MNYRALVLAAGLATANLSIGADATDPKWYLELETGPTWVSRNDVQIPNDEGTRFDLMELTGSGPEAYVRFYATYAFNERHALRLNIAPLEFSGTGTLPEPVRFTDQNFAADQATRGDYKFNNYRLTYRYTFYRGDRWDFGAGGALLVRDAKIELTQGDTRALDDDLGVVPVAHFYAAYKARPKTTLIFDLEGAVAPQGRAIDAAFKLRHQLDNNWDMSVGYRTLEGGADNDSLYTFAWIHYATLAIGYRF